jgi:hypothetical protein
LCSLPDPWRFTEQSNIGSYALLNTAGGWISILAIEKELDSNLPALDLSKVHPADRISFIGRHFSQGLLDSIIGVMRHSAVYNAISIKTYVSQLCTEAATDQYDA